MVHGVRFAILFLVTIGCQKGPQARTPLTPAGEQVSVLVDRPQAESYRAVGDFVGVAKAPRKSQAIAEATDSLRNQAAEHGAGMIYIQRVDAEVDWRESLTSVKVFATAYKNEP